jgi:hypothetical protein
MKGKEKTKERLIDELARLRTKITELEHVKRRNINSSSHMERYFNQ